LRLDHLLVQRGLFASREQARRAVMAGTVQVEGRRVDKPGTPVGEDAAVSVLAPKEPFVSRAGRKLADALDHFEVDPAGRVCLDVGASTGGFTDCLLQRGAARVYALDVGYGQLDHKLRYDERVVVMERVNARHLEPDALPEPSGLITIDVSFISLAKVVPALLPHLAPGGLILALIKPQFEAGRGVVGKGGILRDEEVDRLQAQLSNILEGRSYINFHTTQFAGGEIRGNISPIPEPETYALMLAGLGAMSLVARKRRRPGI
jgi:23S rRNA (cytidine1920-2'-O)/16S rRNA (cytidine1409-2'-O)-methyltransferase